MNNFPKDKPEIQVKPQLQKFVVDLCLHLSSATCKCRHNHMYTPTKVLYIGVVGQQETEMTFKVPCHPCPHQQEEKEKWHMKSKCLQ